MTDFPADPEARTYAAIRLSQDTMTTILAHVAEVPQGRERLMYAMLRYPYRLEIPHYFVGGNYLKLQQPNYLRQILTQTQLDLLFKYRPFKYIGGKPDPNKVWFPVRLKENVSPHMIVA